MKRERRLNKSRVRKRSINVGAHKTSLTLEEEFWQGLRDIAVMRNLSLSKLVAAVDTDRERDNFSSVIRVFVLEDYMTLAEQCAGGKGKQ
jgi:predicted DNA-binding ribbon-helix-helix protein